MPHPEDDVGFLNRRLHPDTVVDSGGHGLLAEDVIALLSERKRYLHVHLILYGNENGICKTLSNGLDRFLRCLEQVLPGLEDESLVN